MLENGLPLKEIVDWTVVQDEEGSFCCPECGSRKDVRIFSKGLRFCCVACGFELLVNPIARARASVEKQKNLKEVSKCK